MQVSIADALGNRRYYRLSAMGASLSRMLLEPDVTRWAATDASRLWMLEEPDAADAHLDRGCSSNPTLRGGQRWIHLDCGCSRNQTLLGWQRMHIWIADALRTRRYEVGSDGSIFIVDALGTRPC